MTDLPRHAPTCALFRRGPGQKACDCGLEQALQRMSVPHGLRDPDQVLREDSFIRKMAAAGHVRPVTFADLVGQRGVYATNEIGTTYEFDPMARGHSLDPKRCANLCCIEHLVQCPDDGWQTHSEAGDFGLRRCEVCEVHYCPAHLEGHICEKQRQLRIALVRGDDHE